MFLLVTRPPGRRIQDGEISKRIVCLCLTKSHRKVGIRNMNVGNQVEQIFHTIHAHSNTHMIGLCFY